MLRTSQRAVPACRPPAGEAGQGRVWPLMAKAKSKRLGLRKSSKIGNTCADRQAAGRESYRRRRFSCLYS
ncbi:MAG: hypothetical protein V2A64_00960 [Candidatus Omnitrophota bacterium]